MAVVIYVGQLTCKCFPMAKIYISTCLCANDANEHMTILMTNALLLLIGAQLNVLPAYLDYCL